MGDLCAKQLSRKIGKTTKFAINLITASSTAETTTLLYHDKKSITKL